MRIFGWNNDIVLLYNEASQKMLYKLGALS
jgi:hypothetical protein